MVFVRLRSDSLARGMNEVFVERAIDRLLREADRQLGDLLASLTDAAMAIESIVQYGVAVIGPTVLSMLVGILVWRSRSFALAVPAAASVHAVAVLVPGPQATRTVAQVLLATLVAVGITLLVRVLARRSGLDLRWPRTRPGRPVALVTVPFVILISAFLGPARTPWFLLAGFALVAPVHSESVNVFETPEATTKTRLGTFGRAVAETVPVATATILVLGMVGGGGIGWHLINAVGSNDSVSIVTTSAAAGLLGLIAMAIAPRRDIERSNSEQEGNRTNTASADN